jgi:abhydrolase domain-containing protein 4
VNLEECVGKDDKIWTMELNAENKDIPIVILHGFGAGIGYWSLNFETLAKNHHVYAFDILGLSRSSRPQFSDDAETIEDVRTAIYF